MNVVMATFAYNKRFPPDFAHNKNPPGNCFSTLFVFVFDVFQFPHMMNLKLALIYPAQL